MKTAFRDWAMRAPSAIPEVFKCQVIASVIALIIVVIFFHLNLMSFVLGAAVMLLGNAFLCWCVWRRQNQLRPLPLLIGFFCGETGKYGVLVILTILIAKTIPLNGLFYAIGIVTPQLFGLIVYGFKNHHRKKR